jgi:hypothetical protein
MATNNATNTSNPVTVGQGGTGDTSFTAYSVLTGGTTSTGALQNVSGVGTTGQLLVSNGASALPTWQTVGTGNLVLIQSLNASSSATISFTTGITSTYTSYLFVFSALLPATNTATFGFQVSTNGGSSYISSGYSSGINYNNYNSASFTNANSTTNAVLTGPLSTTSGYGFSGYLNCYNISNGDNVSFAGLGSFYGSSSGQGTMVTYGAGAGTTTDVTAFQFSMSSGNIASGTISLFGILE